MPLQSGEKQRLHGLDYLRGLTAVGIMIYHYSSWTYGEQAASSFLGRIGIYGVAIFYVLSGQALTYMYASKLALEPGSLTRFYIKRFFRIFPLLWLVTFLSIILSKRIPDVLDLFLNLTGLFGLVKWNTYYATGAWSIGNELTFYLVFPLLIYSFNKSRTGLFIIALSTALLFIYFAFYKITPVASLSSQWHLYTNPLNQFTFFLGGCLIGRFINPASLKAATSLSMGVLGLAVLLFIPIGPSTTELVTGLNRLIFTGSCFLICCGFFRTAQAVNLLDKPLALLGQISYSLYLLHPIVYAFAKAFFSLLAKLGFTYPVLIAPLLASVASVAISYLSYHYFEVFFMSLARRRADVIANR
ncbi:acyltransferase [Hymenobacter sp. BT683]|uniref:Acyltransferase n=1 Tax=Hymenobacter jeongseonensis TaxID=2791027 RepID=A0ABS0IGD9_9BACT|nr:acyltransferase [Hymenobacter jeongseonensis]MBF9237426.1 acyltransferase [Hymenobacter jeongseonensis]